MDTGVFDLHIFASFIDNTLLDTYLLIQQSRQLMYPRHTYILRYWETSFK